MQRKVVKRKDLRTAALLVLLTAGFFALLTVLRLRDTTELTVPGVVLTEQAVPQDELAPEIRKLDLNTADAQELEALVCIGPTLTARILDYRREHGGFREVEELMEIRGIGPGKMRRLREFVEVTVPPGT